METGFPYPSSWIRIRREGETQDESYRTGHRSSVPIRLPGASEGGAIQHRTLEGAAVVLVPGRGHHAEIAHILIHTVLRSRRLFGPFLIAHQQSFADTALSGGRPSPKEAGKASRPLRGKRVPWQAARTRNKRHPPASARRYWAVSGLRLIGSASGREGESRALLGPLGLTLTRTGRFMGWHVMRLSCGFHAAGSRVAAGLLGLTRNYSDSLCPSGAQMVRDL